MNDRRFTLDDLNQIADRGVDMADVITVLQELKAMGFLAPEGDYFVFALEVEGARGWEQEKDHNHMPLWFDGFQAADDAFNQCKKLGMPARLVRQRRSTVEVMNMLDVIACRINS